MLKLFENLDKSLNAGQNLMLVATVESTGSSPRSAGAYMLVGNAGRIYGTIGGGELEYRATFRAQELLAQEKNELMGYDLSNDTAAGLRMICGGSTRVLFRCFRWECPADCQFAREALSLARQRKPYGLLLPLAEGEAQVLEKPDIPRRAFGYQENGLAYYAEQFNFDGKVYIFGGGHLSRELVPMLSHVGFCCIVADDREEFARQEHFPGAQAVKKVDFTGLNEAIGPADYIIIATRGHLADMDCLRFALNTDAKYIGVVGSRRKVKFIREQMQSEGFAIENINRIVSPIGLPIDSETPAEIAVSITAQLIQVRANWSK